jgi:hypothetical protein
MSEERKCWDTKNKAQFVNSEQLHIEIFCLGVLLETCYHWLAVYVSLSFNFPYVKFQDIVQCSLNEVDQHLLQWDYTVLYSRRLSPSTFTVYLSLSLASVTESTLQDEVCIGTHLSDEYPISNDRSNFVSQHINRKVTRGLEWTRNRHSITKILKNLALSKWKRSTLHNKDTHNTNIYLFKFLSETLLDFEDF